MLAKRSYQFSRRDRSVRYYLAYTRPRLIPSTPRSTERNFEPFQWAVRRNWHSNSGVTAPFAECPLGQVRGMYGRPIKQIQISARTPTLLATTNSVIECATGTTYDLESMARNWERSVADSVPLVCLTARQAHET